MMWHCCAHFLDKQKRFQVITGLTVFWCSIRHVDFTIVLDSTTLQYEQLCCTFVMYFWRGVGQLQDISQRAGVF